MTTNHTTFAIGDHVVLDHGAIRDSARGQVLKVAGVSRVNLKLTPIGGGTATLAPTYAARLATSTERAAADAAAKAAPPPLYLGSVVIARGRSEHFVVIGLPSGKSDKYRVAQLGGTETNSYLAGVRGAFTLVDRSHIAIN
jgi:hypothetical protein